MFPAAPVTAILFGASEAPKFLTGCERRADLLWMRLSDFDNISSQEEIDHEDSINHTDTSDLCESRETHNDVLLNAIKEQSNAKSDNNEMLRTNDYNEASSYDFCLS